MALINYTYTIGSGGGTPLSIDTTGATLLVVSVSYYSGGGNSPSSITDTKGNTWTSLTTRAPGTTGHRFYYSANPTVGTSHTVTVLGTNIYAVITFAAFSDISTASPFQVENGATTSSASPLATGSVTPSQSGALIVSAWSGMNATNTPNVGSGLTKIISQDPVTSTSVAGAFAYLVQTPAAAINPSWSWTGTDTVVVAVAVFLPTATAIARLSQLPVEAAVLSDIPVAFRLSQLPIEAAVLSDVPVSFRLSQLAVEVAVLYVPTLPDPIAYWPFDEATGTTAADASGNGHTATLVNGTWDTSSNKKFGASALANTDVARAASIVSFNIGTVNSIAFWMNGWDGVNDGVIIGGPSNSYPCYINSYEYGYSTDGSIYNFKTHGPLTGSRHVVITRNNTTVTWYEGGVSLGSTTLYNNTACTIDSFCGRTSIPTPFVGTIDDLRIYDVELTAAQVTALYALVPSSSAVTEKTQFMIIMP